MKRLLKIVCGFGLAGIVVVFSIILRVQDVQSGSIIKPDPGLRSDVAMVLGASVLSDQTPSDALHDRLLVGIQLYKNHNVNRILLTGDDGRYHVDEIDVMKQFVVEQGVPESDILIDGQGYRTYESCKRAAQVFHLRDILVVTQRFHMARALYLCRQFGLSAFGVTSDLQTYQKNTFFWTRDLAASVEAWWDINVRPPSSPVPATK